MYQSGVREVRVCWRKCETGEKTSSVKQAVEVRDQVKECLDTAMYHQVSIPSCARQRLQFVHNVGLWEVYGPPRPEEIHQQLLLHRLVDRRKSGIHIYIG